MTCKSNQATGKLRRGHYPYINTVQLFELRVQGLNQISANFQHMQWKVGCTYINLERALGLTAGTLCPFKVGCGCTCTDFHILFILLHESCIRLLQSGCKWLTFDAMCPTAARS